MRQVIFLFFLFCFPLSLHAIPEANKLIPKHKTNGTSAFSPRSLFLANYASADHYDCDAHGNDSRNFRVRFRHRQKREGRHVQHPPLSGRLPSARHSVPGSDRAGAPSDVRRTQGRASSWSPGGHQGLTKEKKTEKKQRRVTSTHMFGYCIYFEEYMTTRETTCAYKYLQQQQRNKLTALQYVDALGV